MVWKPQCTLRYQNYLGWSIYQCYMTHGLNVLTYKAVKINSPETEPLFASSWPGIYQAIQAAEGQTPPPQEAYFRPTTDLPEQLQSESFTVSMDVAQGVGTLDRVPNTNRVPSGTSVTFMAQAAEGWQFGHWTYDAGFLHERNISTSTFSRQVTADAIAEAYFISTPPDDGGDGFIDPSLAVDPLDGGTAASSYGPWTWGTSITVTATPSSGYRFDHWHRSQTGEDVTGNPHTFTNLQSAENFTAVFVQIGDGGDGGDGDGRPPSGCFIATACYGSPTHLRVCQLRALKDTLVAKSRIASFFYHVYYVFSPAVAAKIGNMRKTKATIRKTIEVVWRLIRR